MTTPLAEHKHPREIGTGLNQGRVALVTGGTRGIGAAICRELADQGANVAAGFWHGHEAAERFLTEVATEHPDQRITMDSHRQGITAVFERI